MVTLLKDELDVGYKNMKYNHNCQKPGQVICLGLSSIFLSLY